jgi:hypothetical protein
LDLEPLSILLYLEYARVYLRSRGGVFQDAKLLEGYFQRFCQIIKDENSICQTAGDAFTILYEYCNKTI